MPPLSVRLPTVGPMSETPLARTRRARRMYRELADFYPYAQCELDFSTPLELLVATILSAQTTDVGVNKVTPTLFARYLDAAAYAAADRAELEAIILPRCRSVSAARSRAGSPTWSPCPASAARRRMSSSAMPSGCRGSPSTPTSAGWCAGSAGRRRRTR